MTRQVTDQLYIELGYYNPEEYYTYEASAESALSNEATMSVTVGVIKNADSAVNSEFTQTAQAVKLVEGNINLNCEFTQTATISAFEGSDMFAFTEAQIAVQVDRIRDTNIEVSDVFSIATDVVRYRDIASDSVSESTITIGNQRILNFQSAVQGAFSISADVIRFRRSPVALSSTVSLQSSLTGTANARVGFARSPKTITVNGTVTRNTTIKKFGDSSAQFAATGVNYLTITPFSDLNRGTTGDFTIEGWFYHTARGSFFEFRNEQGNDGFYIYTTGTGIILFHRGTSLINVSGVLPQNQWNHIALSRQGSDLRLFANGTQAGSTYTTVVNFNPVRFEIGRRYDSVDPLRGYADEIRVSSSARYLNNFTPSTSAFTNDANTLFLSHFDQSPFADDAGTSTTLSQFTMFIVSGDVESGSAGLESAFTINISAGVRKLAQSTQTVQSQIAIDAVKSVEASVSLSSEFQQSSTVAVNRNIEAALTSSSSLSTDFTRLRFADSNVESDSNLNSTVEKIIQLASDAGSLFDVGVSAVATINSFAILDSSTQLNAVVQANINAGSNISAASNLQSAIEKIITAESSVNSEFSQTTDVIKFKNVVVSMVANAAISTVVTVPTQRPRPVFLNNASSQSRTGIETSIKKFGSASGYVIGTGYAEYTATNGDLTLGTGDFAIEIWMYPVVSRANDFAILSNPYALTINALVPKMLLGSVTLTSSTAATLNSWNHLVISKTGSRSSMFLNGTRVATSTTAWTAGTSSTLRIRGYSKPAPLDDDPGIYYDDFSFHKGSDIGFNAANTTITIPTEARINLPTGTDPNQTSTQLLVHFDGNFDDDISIIEQAQAGLTSSSTLSANGARNRSVAASISSASSVIVSGTTLIDSAASLTSQGFVVAAVARKVDELAVLSSESTLTANAGIVLNSNIDITSVLATITTVTRIKSFNSTLTGAFNASTTVKIFEGFALLTLPASASLTVNGGYQQGGLRSTITSAGSLNIVPNVNEKPYLDSDYSDPFYQEISGSFQWQFPINRPNSGDDLIDVVFGSSNHSSNPPIIQISYSNSQGSDNLVISFFYLKEIGANQYQRYARSLIYYISEGTTNNLTVNQWRNFSFYARVDFNGAVTLTADFPMIYEDLVISNDASGPIYSLDIDTSPGYSIWENNIIPNGQQGSGTGQTTFIRNANVSQGFYVGQVANFPKIISLDLLTTSNLNILVTENGQANITSVSTLNFNGVRNRIGSSNQSVSSSLSSTATKIVTANSTVSSSATLASDVRRFRTGSSNLSTAVTVTITGQRVRFADSQISSTASLTASADRTRTLASSITSNADQNTVGQRIRYFDTDFESLATQLTAAGYNATGTVLLESRFDSSVEAQKTTDVVSNLVIDTDFTVVNDRFRSFDSSITSETIVFAEALNIRPAGSSMEVTTSLSINTDNSRIVGVTANNISEFTQTTVNDTLRLAVATLSATATASILAFKVKQFNIALTSQASIQTLTGIRADARADLPAISVQLTVGDVINIDPFYQIKVEPESRQGTVRPENRVIQVEQETRLNMIL